MSDLLDAMNRSQKLLVQTLIQAGIAMKFGVQVEIGQKSAEGELDGNPVALFIDWDRLTVYVGKLPDWWNDPSQVCLFPYSVVK